jgi:hypothetical protein
MKPDPTSLDRLHDVVTPPPAPWWPPTVGWAIVFSAAALWAAAWLLKAFMNWQADRYRREALARLDDPATLPSEWPVLLKRAALAVWPRDEVADLTGEAWLAFLDRTAGMNGFVAGPGQGIERLAFGAGDGADLPALKAIAREWLRRHRKEAAA